MNPLPPPAVAARHGRSCRPLHRLAVAAALLAAAAAAPAAEFRSIGSAAAVLYDGPSRQATRLFVAPRGMPVEVVSTLGQWVKVRDMAGDVVWVERTELAERRTVVAAALATVRQAPQDTAPVVLHADRGVLFDLVEAPAGGKATPGGWVQVRHRDGGAGFVRAAELWGH
jgi:SH3-like domain-containing protein